MIQTVTWFCPDCGHRTIEDKGAWSYIDCPYCNEPMEVEDAARK